MSKLHLLSLQPTYDFFEKVGFKPWPFQEEVWNHYIAGRSGLLHVPTGSGKTLAAFGGPLAHLIQEPQKGVQIIYITPLRATVNDIYKAIELFLETLKFPLKMEVRTGDTSQTSRQRQKKHPPAILLTTPESLALMLSDPYFKDAFNHLKAVIVDEWHELLGNKRGVMLELLLSHLSKRCPPYRLWGMSATLGNMQESAKVLGGLHHELVHVTIKSNREIILESVLPAILEQLPWSGFFGLKMLPFVLKNLDLDHYTLLFTNTRAQAEKWFEAISFEKPEWKAFMAIHHSSIDQKERKRVEEAIKSGELRLVICTSSLDLGVDFPHVKKVIQIGSTKSLARLLQRAGRSNHRPMMPCHLLIVPTHAMELVEFLSLRKALDIRWMESKTPLKNCWDVLIQNLISRASFPGFTQEDIYEEIKNTYAFSTLTNKKLEEILAFLEKGSGSLEAYPEFHKLKCVDGVFCIQDRKIIQLHRMNIGTIPSSTMLSLKFLKGKKIGMVEENFINRLKPGETFIFGGKSYQLVLVNQSDAWVRLSKKPAVSVAQWVGTRLPLSTGLSQLMRKAVGGDDSFSAYPERELFSQVIEIQKKISAVPNDDEILVEISKTRHGWHLFFYPFESRMIHQTLNALIAYRLLRSMKSSFTLASNDYGCEILSSTPFEKIETTFKELFTEENLENDLQSALNLAEMAKTTFRDIARIAGLVIQGYPTKRKSMRQIQMTTSLLYDVFAKYDPENLLLIQAKHEVMIHDIQWERLNNVLKRIRESPLKFVYTSKLSPFALPLFVEGESSHLSNESMLELMEKIQKSWNKK